MVVLAFLFFNVFFLSLLHRLERIEEAVERELDRCELDEQKVYLERGADHKESKVAVEVELRHDLFPVEVEESVLARTGAK